MRQTKSIVVGGIGNPLMSDEGVGIHVIHALSGKEEHSSNVDFIELGTSTMNVIHAIAGKQKAILVDCACMDEETGTIRRFTPDDVVSSKEMPHFSLHEGDLLDAIKLSRILGECPEEIVIFGIEPENIEFGEDLSPALMEQIENYLRIITEEIESSVITE